MNEGKYISQVISFQWLKKKSKQTNKQAFWKATEKAITFSCHHLTLW
jgi:hypothetical protein